jgi:DNA mismatch endonuclease (patch repair protein)
LNGLRAGLRSPTAVTLAKLAGNGPPKRFLRLPGEATRQLNTRLPSLSPLALVAYLPACQDRGDEKANNLSCSVALLGVAFPQDGKRRRCASAWRGVPSAKIRNGFLQQMDTLTRTERSKRMALIHGKNTKPELLVRKIARSCGYRFRLHVPNLPGKPDIVFPKRRKVIFVHGCFWHRHPSPSCALARLPKSKLRFWLPKLTANRRGDLRNIARSRRDTQDGYWTVRALDVKRFAAASRSLRRVPLTTLRID